MPTLVQAYSCLLYTSDAADERSSVDLGGRRIIKKKKDIESGDAGACRRTHERDNEQDKGTEKTKNGEERKK